MKRILLVVAIAISMSTVNAQPFNAKLSARLQSTLDSMVTMFSNNTKGVAAGVYCPGQGQWLGASGISHPGTPLTVEMAQGIASNSKLFSAVAVLKLQEGGILSLNDPLSKWIGSYKNISPSITIQQLLNHTSGVSDPFLTTALLDTLQKYPTRVYTPQDILALVGAPAKAPGVGYNYSNINYILAGMVVQSATGRSLGKIIRDSILDPLHLEHTFYDIEEAEIGTLAYRWHRGVDIHDSSRVSLNTAGGPAGSIFSTPSDIVRWYTVLMSGGVLKPSSFTALTNFLSPQNYALGLQKTTFFGRETWGHAGSIPGYKSRVIHDPCMQATVCCLSNDDYSAVDGITATLYRILTESLPLCPGQIIGPDTICHNQQNVRFTIPQIGNALKYVWSFPDGRSDTTTTTSVTRDFNGTVASGTLNVRGLNDYGLGATSLHTITVVNLAPSISQHGMTLTCDSAATTYQWMTCTTPLIPIPGATNRSFTASTTGRYAVVVGRGQCLDTSACSGEIVADVYYSKEGTARIVTDISTGQSTVYLPSFDPNVYGPIVLNFYDCAGRLVHHALMTEPEYFIEHAHLAGGVYLIEMKNDTGCISRLHLCVP